MEVHTKYFIEIPKARNSTKYSEASNSNYIEKRVVYFVIPFPFSITLALTGAATTSKYVEIPSQVV